jgi:repressor LexA
MADGLTPPQQALLLFLEERLDGGDAPPTYREMCKHMSYSSPKAASDLVRALERKGYVTRDRKRARGLRLTAKAKGVPFLGRIAAGHAHEVQPVDCEWLIIGPKSFGIRDRTKAFALRVTGDSMIGQQIFDGDIVLVERGVVPQHGDVVAALIDGESTLKTLVRRGNKTWLHAENPLYPDLIPAWDLHIQGVARAVFRVMST